STRFTIFARRRRSRRRSISSIPSPPTRLANSRRSVQWTSVMNAPHRTHITATAQLGRAFLSLEGVATPEVRCDLLHRHPPHTVVPVDVFDHPLEHEKHLGSPPNVRLHGEGEHGVVHLPLHPVE